MQDGRVVWGAGLRHQSYRCRRFKTHSSHFVDILYKVSFPLFWKHAHGIFYHYPCYLQQNIQAGWTIARGAGFRAPVTSGAWVPVPLLSLCDIPFEIIASFILKTCIWYLLPLSMLLITKHTGRMAEWYEALVYGHQSLCGRGFESLSCHYVDILIQSVVSLISNSSTWCLLPTSMQLKTGPWS